MFKRSETDYSPMYIYLLSKSKKRICILELYYITSENIKNEKSWKCVIDVNQQLYYHDFDRRTSIFNILNYTRTSVDTLSINNIYFHFLFFFVGILDLFYTAWLWQLKYSNYINIFKFHTCTIVHCIVIE